MKEILRDLPLFSGLGEGPLELLSQIGHTRTLADGERLFEEGDSGEEVFVVLEGVVRIAKRVPAGGERTLATLNPGAMFGEASIIDQEERSAAAVARSEVKLLVLPADPMREWLIANPEVGIMVLGRLGSMMLERLRTTNGLLRETISWGVEVSGAARVSLESFVTAFQSVTVQLLTGRDITGRIVKAEQGPEGLELWLSTDAGRTHIVPYRAIADIAVHLDLPALAAEGS